MNVTKALAVGSARRPPLLTELLYVADGLYHSLPVHLRLLAEALPLQLDFLQDNIVLGEERDAFANGDGQTLP